MAPRGDDGRQVRERLRRAARRHPAAGALVAAGAAWTAMVALHGGPVATGHDDAPLAAALALWALMSVAMMVPVVLPAVRHVAANSLRWRRQRAIAEFLAAYLAVWIAFGAVALSAVSLASGFLIGTPAVVAALVIAAAWQLLPFQRRFVRACHRTVALPPRGWRAAAGCLRFGWRQGRACVGICWPLMLVMALVIHESLLWMAALAFIVAARRLLPRADRLSRPLAGALGAAALALAVLSPPVGPVYAERAGAHAHSTWTTSSGPAAPLWLCAPRSPFRD